MVLAVVEAGSMVDMQAAGQEDRAQVQAYKIADSLAVDIVIDTGAWSDIEVAGLAAVNRVGHILALADSRVAVDTGVGADTGDIVVLDSAGVVGLHALPSISPVFFFPFLVFFPPFSAPSLFSSPLLSVVFQAAFVPFHPSVPGHL